MPLACRRRCEGRDAADSRRGLGLVYRHYAAKASRTSASTPGATPATVGATSIGLDQANGFDARRRFLSRRIGRLTSTVNASVPYTASSQSSISPTVEYQSVAC